METELKKILIIPAYQIYPESSGSSWAQMTHIYYLQNHFKIHLFLSVENVSNYYFENFKKGLNSNVSFTYVEQDVSLKIGSEKRVEKLKGLKNRIERVIKLFLKYAKNKLQRVAKDELNMFESTLFKLAPKPAPFSNTLSDILEREKFDLIQVDLFANLSIVPLLPKDTPSVYICHECKYVRHKGHLDVRGINEHSRANYLRLFYENSEKSFMNNFDHIVVFSEEDRKRLDSTIDRPIHVSPFTVAGDSIISNDLLSNNCKIDKIVFLGIETHFPNYEGVEWVLEGNIEYFRSNKTPTYIIGKWNEKTVEKWKDKFNVKFPGFVKELDDFLKGSVLIAPIRIGGGIKSKVLKAMSRGVPVIATSFALEGINVENNKHVLIANSPEEIIACLERLLDSKELQERLIKNSLKLLNDEMSPENVGNQRREILDQIIRYNQGLN